MRTVFKIEFEESTYELQGNSFGKEILYRNDEALSIRRSFGLSNTYKFICPVNGTIELFFKLNIQFGNCYINISKNNEILKSYNQSIEHIIPKWAKSNINDQNDDLIPKSKKRRTLNSLISIALAVIVWGLLFSWTMALLLVLVLFIHELGHFTAMAIFGYKNKNIIFTPPFGAVAIGYKEKPVAWQEMIIVLAGPLPGIIIGLTLYFSGITIISPRFTVGLLEIFLLINYLNLIPISPLDGGRIVELVFLHKFPRIQLVFAATGVLLFLVLGIVQQEIFTMFAALLFGLVLYSRINESKNKKEKKYIKTKDKVSSNVRFIIGSSYIALIISFVIAARILFI